MEMGWLSLKLDVHSNFDNLDSFSIIQPYFTGILRLGTRLPRPCPWSCLLVQSPMIGQFPHFCSWNRMLYFNIFQVWFITISSFRWSSDRYITLFHWSFSFITISFRWSLSLITISGIFPFFRQVERKQVMLGPHRSRWCLRMLLEGGNWLDWKRTGNGRTRHESDGLIGHWTMEYMECMEWNHQFWINIRFKF